MANPRDLIDVNEEDEGMQAICMADGCDWTGRAISADSAPASASDPADWAYAKALKVGTAHAMAEH